MGLCFYFDHKEVSALNCELCGRVVLPEQKSDHHLNPVSQGGRKGNIVTLHELCHRQIHALYTDFELSLMYDSMDKLKASVKIQRFLRWVENKDVGFTVKIRESRDRRRKRCGR